MQPKHYSKVILMTLVLVIGFITFWEYFWRSKGFPVAHNDDKFIWAEKRHEVYYSRDQATVFIGGSRIKFDLDIPTWEKEAGEKAVQLALVGTSPRLILHDLANDSQFNGKLIIDVTEIAFFSAGVALREKSAQDGIEYFNNETPAQKTSAAINYFLETKLVFLEEGKFGLNALLSEAEIPNRPGINVRVITFKEFSTANGDRQTLMTPMFLSDPRLQKRMIDIRNINLTKNRILPLKGDKLEALLAELKLSIDKIRARGGMVLFVRPPSGGALLEREHLDFPRTKYWDHLLEYTNTPGFYFADYPGTASLDCPEMSHLSPSGAVLFTRQLVKTLKEEKGWIFPHSPKSLSYNIKP